MKSSTLAKLERMKKALSHQQPDRVPIGDFFWTGFMNSCRKKYGADFNPYSHWDLDYSFAIPNMDPKIQPFEVIYEKGDDILIKTGFGATIRRTGELPMPHYDSFSVNAPEEMAKFEFDSPSDPRRFYQGGDDQISCVGDSLARNLPPWDERLNGVMDDFPVFGAVCEPYEYLWRIIGTENALLWMATEEELFADFVNRVGKFLLEFTRAQIEAAKGRLSGFYIFGDVAYVRGMLFGAERWRQLFKPHVKALIDLLRANKLMVIYHGCGDAHEIFPDMVEIGLDAYNPLEAKAGLDVVQLKKQYAGKLAFVGNIDVRALETNDPDIIRREVEYKMQAAKGGGWVFQSDHSVTSSVNPESYDLAVKIARGQA